MKTIEEKMQEASNEAAREWVNDTMETGFERVDPIRHGYFVEGAKWMRNELTRWNDPKEVLPEVDKMVLVKRKPDAPLPYDLAQYDGSCWIDSWCGLMIDIIGWREIHE